ncbi:MAG: hypothetical protein IANPNBLG_04748 [Bryobacteraceae bacterium]|nr:hypothetical protein [Bryobacteraceae bacterium]
MKFSVFLLAIPLFAVIDGSVINRTTGKPQHGATVTVYKLGTAGIESLESVKTDAAGRFSFTADPGPGPALLQGAWDGVTYNKMLTPNTPRTGVEVDVWNSQSKPGTAKVAQHMVLFEPVDGKLMVNENIIYQNPGLISYNNPDNGTLQFYLPPEANGKVKVECTAPQGMAIERAAMPTKVPNVYGVDFPIKPGETRFQLAYEIPAASPAVFTGRILHKEGVTRLVTPRGVTLKGEGVRELGREPSTQAAIYSLSGQNLKVEIEGSGSMSDASAASGDEGPGIQEILPRVYERVYMVLGLAVSILALGFLVLYRAPGNPRAAAPAEADSSPKGKRRA